MFRFSCFSNPSRHRRSKKLVTCSVDDTRAYPNSTQKVDGKISSNSNVEQYTSPASEDCWRSEDFSFCTDKESGKIKKSQSLGDILDPHQHECQSFLGNSELLIEKQCDFEDIVSTCCLVNSGVQSSLPQPLLSRSQSANLDVHIPTVTEDSIDSAQGRLLRSRSCGNFSSLDLASYTEEARVSPSYCKDASEDRVQPNAQSQCHCIYEEIPCESQIQDSGCNNCSADEISLCCVESGNDCHHSDFTSTAVVTLPRNRSSFEDSTNGDRSHNAFNSEDIFQKIDEKEIATTVKNCEPESFYQDCDISQKEFNIRRIENWISQIPVSNDMVPNGQAECSSSAHLMNSNQAGTVRKLNAKSPLGMETAYSYISMLKPSSSTAQLSNLGLVAIPILSVFNDLRLLNLAGNSIIRITSGALPKGLRMLNLSRNNISAIEGLKELTLLRVLDLSYNRIIKIGHGLSSCPFLKELYIGGNSISEVEGLHRLKLKVLDLHSNKLASSKCLDQLANCGTLQSITLDGNPAEKNIGDEPLKRHVLGLLPRLVFYNKQAVRTSRWSSKTKPQGGGRHGRAVDHGGGGRSKRLDMKLPRRSACVSVAVKSSGCHRAGAAAAHGHGSARLSKLSRNVTPLAAAIRVADHPSGEERRLAGTENSSQICRIRSADDLC
ncbi:uncharacterized protein LOC102715116 [Oryza brachyantha]|uniref:uncharacterized protein LOC102715116 n=1 Tax=Oryza brachyantha TaxID=4533 RepID=UPI001AD95B3B|nr:uncharacterized protein LOC102715116 [Oryza brachyantha]XP_040380346.1 uncharacterized protein LOC102715116 [Oryza brachyantha]XP_040380347.1 uncharacterized protein LOC102715116 [Oryza brachyantha]